MKIRYAEQLLHKLLRQFPAVGILGPRQVGKTTLALQLTRKMQPAPIYLDLETPSDIHKLADPELYFETHDDRLIILDEIQHVPDLFKILRGVIDRRRRQNKKTGQFLILGSASLDLLQQSSESLAGRIAYAELPGFNILEIGDVKLNSINRLWLRGGFPNSFLAKSDEESFQWRRSFIQTYLERDVPQFGPRIPATILRNLWTMLAHHQGSLLNQSNLASSLGMTVPTIHRYIALLEDLLLIKKLQPWSNNVGKRLVKSPKVYIRDSGLLHALLNITNLEDLLGHPITGMSWEGFVIENIVTALPQTASTWFYRTAAGAEIDLLIEFNSKKRIAIEVKRSLSPILSKGFHHGFDDVKATHGFIVYPGKERYLLTKNITVIPLNEIISELT